MKNGLYLAAFAAGVAVGAIVAWRCAQKKYEKISQEEIESVKKAFGSWRNERHSKSGEETPRGLNKGLWDKPSLEEAVALMRERGYVEEEADNSEAETGFQPYVITPEEFGAFDDYEQISLTWYADGILADDGDEVVDDVEDIVGDALEHFGEYEDEAVFVRCDERKCDYEILLDQRSYADVVGDKPRQVEV